MTDESAERWEAAKRLFHRAAELPLAERADFVRIHASGDPELVREVLGMLEGDEGAESFLLPPRALVGAASAADSPSPGDGRSFDRLQVFAELGRGAMGTVYRARDLDLDRDVALKVLPKALALDAETSDRFAREARRMAQLRHPSIVSVHRVGSLDGVPYFVMDLVEGHDLGLEIDAQVGRGRDGKAPPQPMLAAHGTGEYFAAVARIAVAIADALAHAHGARIVHRDVKPGNILLGPKNAAVLVDFGLARESALGRDVGHGKGASRPGTLLGTVHYMSPEQVRSSSHTVDHRTDVYSLGVVLYELLTLRRPFHGASELDVLRRIVTDDPPPPRKLEPRVPRDLEAVCLVAMAKDADGRYPSAAALRDDLKRFLSHEGVRATLPGVPQRAVAWARRRKVPLLAALALAVVALLALAWADRNARERQRELWRAELQRVGESIDWPGLAGNFDSQEAERDAIELLSLLARLEGDEQSAPEREYWQGRVDQVREDLVQVGAAARRAAAQPGDVGTRGWWAVRSERVYGRTLRLFPTEARAAPMSVTALVVRPGPSVPRNLRARIHLARVDQDSGRLTPLPGPSLAVLEDAALQPGAYRIRAEFGNGRNFELTRWIGFGEQVEVEYPYPPPMEDVVRGMVLIEGATFTPDLAGEEQHPAHLTSLSVESFYMDATEVTNGEYRRFLEATGHPEPRLWTFLPPAQRPPDWDRLPVTSIAIDDMESYALWAGKRLPTIFEWTLAARGPNNAAWPWRTDRPPAEVGAVYGAVLQPVEGSRDYVGQYVDHARPVDSAPLAATPEGLFHMFGNAIEVTETFQRTRRDGQWETLPNQRYHVGGSWQALQSEFPAFGTVLDDARDVWNDRGFRCVRSVHADG